MWTFKFFLPILLSLYMAYGAPVNPAQNDLDIITLNHTDIAVTTSVQYSLDGVINRPVAECTLTVNGMEQDIKIQENNTIREIINLETGANTIIIKAATSNGDETSCVLQITRR